MAQKKKSNGLFHDYSKTTYIVCAVIIAVVVIAAFIAGHNHMLIPSKSPSTEETSYITTTKAADETTSALVIEDATDEVEETTTTTTKQAETTSKVDESELIGEDAAYRAAIKHMNISDDDITWHSQTLMNNWLYNKTFKIAYMVTFYAPSDDVSDSRHVVMVDAQTGSILQVIA